MTQAKVTKSFPGRRDHESVVREIGVGEIIEGDLAQVAMREGWAEPVVASLETEESGPDLHGMKVPELRAYAHDRGIDLGDATKKDDIIAAIELAADPK